MLSKRDPGARRGKLQHSVCSWRMGELQTWRWTRKEQEELAARPRTKQDASKQANQINQASKRWHKTHNVIAAVG